MYFYLKEPNKDRKTPINLQQYVKDSKRAFKYPLGKSIHPKDWNFDERAPKRLKGRDDLKTINIRIDEYIKFFDKIVNTLEQEDKPVTREEMRIQFDRHFKNKGQATTKINVPEIINLFIVAKNKSEGQSKSWNEKYRNLRNKLLLFGAYKGGEIHFKDIDDDWLLEYAGFLRSLSELLKENWFYHKAVKIKTDIEANKERLRFPDGPYNDNTLNRHINFLFTFLNWSKGKYHSIDLDKLKNPVKDYQPDDVHLTWEEIAALESVDLPRESLVRARDLFLIGVYSGQRFSDYSVFEKADVIGDMIIKKSKKTRQDGYIELVPKLRSLLEKYNWSLPKISSQNFNPHIKEVCKIAGIDDEVKSITHIGKETITNYFKKYEVISSHTARRTFITLSSEAGMPDNIIMSITGITDPNTLLKYKKTTKPAIKHFSHKIWG